MIGAAAIILAIGVSIALIIVAVGWKNSRPGRSI